MIVITAEGFVVGQPFYTRAADASLVPAGAAATVESYFDVTKLYAGATSTVASQQSASQLPAVRIVVPRTAASLLQAPPQFFEEPAVRDRAANTSQADA